MDNRPYVIFADVTCDLPKGYCRKNGITILPMAFSIDGTDYAGTDEDTVPIEKFYGLLRGGKRSKTSAVTIETARAAFEEELKKGNDILYLGFSSALSGSFQSCFAARQELVDVYPEATIYCVDTLCASLGQGLLIDYIVRKRGEGVSLEEAADIAEKVKWHVCHYFTVDDLNHLYRGGRVTRTAAIFGTMLGIKPIMHVDNEGRLIPHGKVRGRRQSLDSLVESMGAKLIEEYKNPYVFISHGDCLPDAKYVADRVKAKFGIKTEIINHVGTVIGTHSGPGTVALFFLGENRDEKKL